MSDLNHWPMRFDKEMTAIVKGLALIFMMLLHCYDDFHYDVALDYSNVINPRLHGVFKVCIGLFTFMVGFGYSFSKNRNWSYAFSHIKKLLIPFWVILLVFTFPFCWGDVTSCGWQKVIYNLFGIDSHFNYYSWYVYFFIYAMVVLPFLSRVIDRSPLLYTLLFIVLSLLLMCAMHFVFDVGANQPAMALFNCFMMTPVMLLGYLFGHKHYYERLNFNGLSKWLCLFLALTIFIVTLRIRYYWSGWNGFQFDFFFAPLIIGSLVVIFNRFELKPIRLALVQVGNVSTYMWFFHALFYTKAVRWFYQPAITIFNDVNLVVIWAIVLTFSASWLIKAVVGRVTETLHEIIHF